jgi:hypothetical protein
MVSYIKHIWGSEKVKQSSRYRRPNRVQKLFEYINNTDTVYESDLNKMSFNNIEYTLRNYTKRYGLTFKKLTNETWEIIR